MTVPARANLMPAAGAVSLLILLLGTAALFTLGLTHSRSAAALDRQTLLDAARTTALETQVDFKTQVQEWKNILLRGRQPEDFTRYLASFEQREAAVQNGLASVKAQLASLDLDASNIDVLTSTHLALGSGYRAALASSRREDPASAFAVDAAVRGRDRQLGDDIDALATHVADFAAKELQTAGEASAALYASLRKAVLIIGTLAVLSALWLVFAATRAARS